MLLGYSKQNNNLDMLFLEIIEALKVLIEDDPEDLFFSYNDTALNSKTLVSRLPKTSIGN